MTLWIYTYHHRYGVDALPYFQDEPPEEAQVIKDIDDAGGDYEGSHGTHAEEDQRDDEWLELHGPYGVPTEEDVVVFIDRHDGDKP